MQAARHQEVARAFRRRGRQDRRLELGEALLLHAAAHRVDDLGAQHDVVVQLLAAQVEEAVLEARILGIFEIAEDWQRQLGRGAEHFDAGREHFHGAGRQVGVLGALQPRFDLAVDAHDPFRAQRLGVREGRRIRVHHHLRHAVMVAQVDEENAPVVADAMAPAGEADILADVAVTERATGMGTIAMQGHGLSLSEMRRWPARSASHSLGLTTRARPKCQERPRHPAALSAKTTTSCI